MGRYLDIARSVPGDQQERSSRSETSPASERRQAVTTYTTETTKVPSAGPGAGTTKTTETTYLPPGTKGRHQRDHLHERILSMSLEQFARENSALELRVPGCTETVWWVPNSRGVDQLMRQGIARGRIWTAQELLQVWEGPPLRPEDAQTLARLKATLNCELSSIQPPDTGEDDDR